MRSFIDFLICAALALQIQSVLSVKMCRNPKVIKQQFNHITEECCNKHPDDYELLFVGPGHPTAVQAIVLNLPELSPSTVFPPPHPQAQTRFYAYVATVWKQQTLLCGGYTSTYLDTCYLLKMFTPTIGYWMPFPPTHHVRYVAAAAWLGKDWWVTGGYDGTKNIKSTELLSPNDIWSLSVDLPEPVRGHSLVNIDSTTLFLCGGYTDSFTAGASYIYTPGGGFVKQPSMSIGRWFQQCTLFMEEIWVVGGAAAGGATTSVEIFSLDTLTWRAGPALPTGIYAGDLLVIDGKLVLIGGIGGGDKIYHLEKIHFFEMKWLEGRTLSQTRSYFKALMWKTYKDN